MKRLFMLSLMVLLCAGCVGGYYGSNMTVEERTWAVGLVGHSTTKEALLNPQTGYVWFVVSVEISNLTQKEHYLSKQITYVASNGNEYSSSFLNSSKFPIHFMPQQTLRGTIYFEVPETYIPEKGFLIFSAQGNTKNIIVDF